MIAYKLFRELKSGEITSLFINKGVKLPYHEWMESNNHPTKGFAIRPGWHCTAKPEAPHLKMKLKSGEKRVWKMVLIQDYSEFTRPENQGGLWYLANKMLILKDELRALIESQMNFEINEFSHFEFNKNLNKLDLYFKQVKPIEHIKVDFTIGELPLKFKMRNNLK